MIGRERACLGEGDGGEIETELKRHLDDGGMHSTQVI